MKVVKRNGKIVDFNISIKEIKKALIQTVEAMQQDIKTILEDNSLSSQDKNNKITITVDAYKQMYHTLKTILKSLVQSIKKFKITSLFLSSQIRGKFKIYNLN